MHLKMMPTAKMKMSGMGKFMSRHMDGTHSGPASPRQGTVSVAPAQQSPPPALQPAPHIVTSRHEIAAAAKIPVPRGGRFGYTTSTHSQSPPQAAQPPTSNSLAPPHYHPMQRSRTSEQVKEASNGHHVNGGIWEDSTVASMFEETDSRAGSDRNRGAHGRTYSESTYTRPPVQHERQRSRDDHPPFVIGKDGLLTVVQQGGAANGPSATTLNTEIQSDIYEQDPFQDDYEQDQQQHEVTPKKGNTLRRTKLPHRDARDGHRNASLERRPTVVSSPPNGSLQGSVQDSPGRQFDQARQLDARLEEARRDEELQNHLRAKQRERELHHKRTTIFADLTPVEDPTWQTQNAVGVPTAGVNSSEDFKEELQRTPKAAAVLPRPPIARPASRQPLAAHSHPLLPQHVSLRGTSLTRTTSRRVARETSKKRQRSPDYNDAELHAMSYNDLMKQDFDYDPRTAVLQQTVPSGTSIEDRLEYYKDKDGLDQHQFFTQISIKEWEDSGDWFLEQFGGIIKKMKEARKNKRNIVSRFENEVAAREEAVRSKTEGIGRTLQELRQEGQTMMQGKDVDV
ncbi:hypothetical protein DL546_009366 [Coniochaeta pulveracea]|uniref:Extracellular mutant protein 11 C-terminal domain-containing protein n=1 Tax=Coniochaeta pulveracea TaxID=177199 RepID=A0A420YM41_9PEZI|nr:hypothetical protein DL546_009366 [Coniochaeta pulveracea]